MSKTINIDLISYYHHAQGSTEERIEAHKLLQDELSKHDLYNIVIEMDYSNPQNLPFNFTVVELYDLKWIFDVSLFRSINYNKNKPVKVKLLTNNLDQFNLVKESHKLICSHLKFLDDLEKSEIEENEFFKRLEASENSSPELIQILKKISEKYKSIYVERNATGGGTGIVEEYFFVKDFFQDFLIDEDNQIKVVFEPKNMIRTSKWHMNLNQLNELYNSGKLMKDWRVTKYTTVHDEIRLYEKVEDIDRSGFDWTS